MPKGIGYDFQTEDDARTLREAQEIKNDPARFSKAKQKLKTDTENAQAAIGGESAGNTGKKKATKKKRRKRGGFYGGIPLD